MTKKQKTSGQALESHGVRVVGRAAWHTAGTGFSFSDPQAQSYVASKSERVSLKA